MSAERIHKLLHFIFSALEWIGAQVQKFTLRNWIIVFIAALFLLMLSHCVAPKHKKTPPPQSVVLAPAKNANVPIYLNALGTVTATYSVTVKSRVNGQLLQVLFKEGQMVKTGDLLAQIDPRPYEALVEQYQGQLVRDTALLLNAKLDLKRYAILWKQNSVAKQVYDTQVALVKQDEGVVQLDEGLLQGAKVNLFYTKITSPIDGRIGLRLVDPGNIIQTTDTTGIAVINMLNPITIVFPIPEDAVPAVMKQLTAGKILPVQAYNRDQTKLLATGVLLTIDNQIDPTTGTVKLKASFQNENNLLFPNQFVNVKLLIKTLSQAVVVPVAAIQRNAEKAFVYVLNANQTVSMKPVLIEAEANEMSVVKGVAAGQFVVVEGADKLVDGTAVAVYKG